MAIIGNQITISTSSSAPTVILAPGGSLADCVPILCTVQGAGSAFLNGSTTIGSSSGYELGTGNSLSLSVFGGDRLSAFTNTSGGIRMDTLVGRQ